MCGIFGLVKNEKSNISDSDTLEVINKLFIFSQTRGSEAAGIAINTGRSIDVYKKAGSPREFVKSLEYKSLFKNSIIRIYTLQSEIISAKIVYELIKFGKNDVH